MQPTNDKHSQQAFAGWVLTALGVFIFCANLDRPLIELIHTLGSLPRQALGVIPTLVVAAAGIGQTDAANRACFLHVLVLQVLASAWPLLLVAAGTMLSRNAPAD